MEGTKETESKMTPCPAVDPYNWPKEMEEMKPEKETLSIDQSKVPTGMINCFSTQSKEIFKIQTWSML
jgi:hypothetical protein